MSERRWLVLILLVAFGLRLALWSQPLHEPANDEVEYIAVARDLVAGRGWVYYDHYRWLRAPLYPLFLAASLWFAGGDLHLAALPNLLLSTSNVLLAFWVARALVGRRVALLAAAISALLWTNATFASLYMAETLFTTLFSLALLATLRLADWHRAPPVAAGLAALAGLLFGLAALTRSAVLLFLPVVAGWLIFRHTGVQPMRRFALALVFGIAVIIPILPWSARNDAAYGQPILIETGLSYNMWAFNEPRESLDTIHQTLEHIPNPAVRSEYAMARGLQRLREDPAILARKLWPNWVFLARVKPIQDRFLMQNYYDSVDLPLFVAALVFDDLLYIAVALAAIVGLSAILAGMAGRLLRGPAWLCAAWCGYLLVTLLLTHGEARYRHFLFPVLIPYAAWAVLHARQAAALVPRAAWQRLLLASTLLVFTWSVTTSYPRAWAAENLTRGWHTLVGDLARRAGRCDLAIDQYSRAAASQRVPEPLLRLGDCARATAQPQQALAAYQRALRIVPFYEPSLARLGDLLRALGRPDDARRAFLADYADQQRMLDWSWRELHPAPATSIDIGGGLDYGYVGGFYPAEIVDGATARWSGSQAMVRVGRATNGALRFRMAAPRAERQPVPVQVCVARRCATIQVTTGWREFHVLLPAGDAPDVLIELHAPVFQAPDGRRLGIVLDSLERR